MAGLTALKIVISARRDMISNLVHLPRLHTLDLSTYVLNYQAGVRYIDDDALPLLSALTSLGVHGLLPDRNPDMLPAIAACRHLKQLRLTGAVLRPGELRALFTSPNLSRLQRLELSLFCSEPPVEEFADALAAMTQLRHLVLLCVPHTNSLLSILSRMPHLATVEITSYVPSPHVLQSLFDHTETTSRVHVTLRVARQPPRDADLIPFQSFTPSRLTLVLTK